ncbi:putative U6 snRNA-associated Sm-like protein LSm4 [Diplonema papillatum]|nr:putative U6 snRNA-associated Sm-like protein LSm4 [Diplonema papillatum]KAJ9454665.1 putative U6 snRNA-associated Sm-like protein LSm4 [Diplonema papillatum]WGM49939.1 LSm4 [Diplonema papillatum]|eukprot:gene467-686_t
MLLPLQLLKTSVGYAMSIELKNGVTYNGHLKSCDDWMNLHLENAICTDAGGDRFWKVTECFVRGNTIRCLRILDVLLTAAEEAQSKAKSANNNKRGKKRPRDNDKQQPAKKMPQ